MAGAAQPRRTQAERRAQTREALVRSAVALIAERGYAEATLQEIAARAGVSKGAVHHHFRAKHDLIAPVLEHCASRVRAALIEGWEKGRTPAERMRAALRALWELRRARVPEIEALGDLLALGRRDQAVRETVTPIIRAAEHDLGAAIARATEAMGLRARVSPALMPRLLLAMLDGIALYEHYDESSSEEIYGAIETLASAMLTM